MRDTSKTTRHPGARTARKTSKTGKAPALGVKADGKATGGGGPTASGGFNYQAAVTAIAMTYALRGLPLQWLDGLVADTVSSVASETGEGGDDIRLILVNGSVVEVQVKKGLTKGASLWTALRDLARALAADTAQFGVLVVSPGSSATVREDIAKEIVALGEGRTPKAGSAGEDLAEGLRKEGWDPGVICARLRIVTVAAAEFSDGDIRASLAHLAAICAGGEEASAAWDRFYRDAHVMIASRGRRDRAALAQVLRSAGVGLRDDAALPSGLIEKLCRWTAATNREFSILGVDRPLSIEAAYVRLDPYVMTEPEGVMTGGDLATAIAHYHDWNHRTPQRDTNTSAPEALGRYFTRAVVVAGPGAGKSTLLARVAAAYAADGAPVLKASARSVARRMSGGQGFEAALFDDALDGAPVTPAQARTLTGVRWTVLLDGLDESAQSQDAVINGLKAFVEGRLETRAIVTTRPVGFQRAGLADWRHYAMPGIAEDDIEKVLTRLLSHMLPAADPRRKSLDAHVKAALDKSGSGKAALRTPLMLGLAAALFAAGGSLGTSRTSFYRGVFDLVSRAPGERLPHDPPAEAVRNRFLDALGWALVANPDAGRETAMVFAAETLRLDLESSLLGAEVLAGRCLDYWQALGVVEELSQAADRALAFVHKTFGEFTAGRYLAKAELDVRKRALERSEADPGLREAVAFAASEGMAPLVLAELMHGGFSGDVGEGRLVQALDVLIDVKPSLGLSEAGPILEAAAMAALDDREGPVGLIGLKLRTLANIYPQPLSKTARSLMASEQAWTRLTGLAVGFVAEPDQMPLMSWVDSVAEVAGPKPDKATRGFRRSDAAAELMQAFAHDVAKRIVGEMSSEEASDVFARAFVGGDLNRVGFIIEMETLLVGTQIKPWWRAGWETSMPKIDGDEISRAIRRAFLAFVRGLRPPAEADDQPRPAKTPSYALSAFMCLVDFGGTSLPDLYPLEDFGEAADVRWLWSNLAVAAGLPLDLLWRDAREMEAELVRADRDALSTMYRETFAVDIAPVDWAQHLQAGVDEALLEQALRRSSGLVVGVAANLALASGADTCRRLSARLLSNGDDEALWAGAAISAGIPREEALALLFEHARGAPRRGTKYVINHLAALEVGEDPRRQDVMNAALLQTRFPSAAAAAAKWFAAHPVPADIGVASRAFYLWLRAEKPTPESGIVPISPRDDLLSGLLVLSPESLSGLLSRWKDSRSDVRSVVRSAFVSLLDRGPEERQDSVRAALSGDLPVDWLRLLVDKADRLSSDQRLALLACLENEDSTVRLAVMPLLKRRDLSSVDRRSRLDQLRKDKENQVREKAASMLRALNRDAAVSVP